MFRITLAAARVNAGYSQKKAAQLLHISSKTLCRWENGESFPDQPKIEAMCKLYQVPYDCLRFASA